jgi:hypothetical protein
VASGSDPEAVLADLQACAAVLRAELDEQAVADAVA